MGDLQKSIDYNVVSNNKISGNYLNDHQEWIDKLWDNNTMKYYIRIEMNRVELHVLTWIHLKNIMWNEKKANYGIGVIRYHLYKV